MNIGVLSVLLRKSLLYCFLILIESGQDQIIGNYFECRFVILLSIFLNQDNYHNLLLSTTTTLILIS